MEIKIKNAGATSEAKLNIELNKLNIKYGINGVGKTTLGKSIFYKLEENDQLESLKKYGSNDIPEVEIPTEIKSAIYFDKGYVDRHLFQEDIANNSYEIIIKTETYDQVVEKIDAKLHKIKEKIEGNGFSDFINVMNDFIKGFPVTAKGVLSTGAKATIVNGLQNGDLTKINPKIETYKKYLTAPNNFDWSAWFEKAESFISGNEHICPYCNSELPENFDETKRIVKETYNSTKIKSNSASKQQLTKISTYADETTKQIISNVKQATGTPTQENLEEIKMRFLTLKLEMQKIQNLKYMTAVNLSKTLKENSLENLLRSSQLEMTVFNDFPADEKHLAQEINNLIASLLESILELKAELGQLQSALASCIKAVKFNVNSFLNIAGIPYVIEVIEKSTDDYKTVLKPISTDIIIADPKNKLSFGEQNAIALVLFSIEALCKNKDLIILDDPVSSFDDTKKYALIYHLFKSRGENNFYGKTVLMLTHDFSPIIDFILNGKPNREIANASYLLNRNGKVFEKEINKNDIKNATVFEEESAQNQDNDIITRIVHLRKHYELTNDKGMEYNLLSSLIHLEQVPYIKNIDGTKVEMAASDIAKAEFNIKNRVESFSDYASVLKLIDDNIFLRQKFKEAGGFGKLNITRIFVEKNSIEKNEVLWKYLCESYHIENNHLYYLNADSFDLIPDYILNECERIICSVSA